MAFPLVFWFLVFPPGATADCLLGASPYRYCCSPLGSPLVPSPSAVPMRQQQRVRCPQHWFCTILRSCLMHLLRSLTHAACSNSFSFSACHTPGRSNVAADALSHFHFQEFHLLVPAMDQHPSPIPPALLPSLVPPSQNSIMPFLPIGWPGLPAKPTALTNASSQIFVRWFELFHSRRTNGR